MSELPENTRNKLMELMAKREAVAAAIEPCSLSDYRKIVGELPRPTANQVTNFVEFVTTAHSWYKHLPLLPPGKSFLFFMDPGSGYDSRILPDGRVRLEERVDESKRFHYTWMPTVEYRARFGHLSYSCSSGTSFTLATSDSVREYATLPIFTAPEGAHRIPPEMALAASVELTAVVHPDASFSWVWKILYPRLEKMDPGNFPRRWPTETGGDSTLQKILVLTRNKSSSEKTLSAMATLLYPERKRLMGLMEDTIQRMLDLIYGTGEPF